MILIGAGFGPLPSITAVAMQNVVARHQLGISVGTMNFSRNLLRDHADRGVRRHRARRHAGGQVAQRRARGRHRTGGASLRAASSLSPAASMSVALIALVLMEEKPLQTGAELDTQ